MTKFHDDDVMHTKIMIILSTSTSGIKNETAVLLKRIDQLLQNLARVHNLVESFDRSHKNVIFFILPIVSIVFYCLSVVHLLL